jgi:PAS domain S-box-containing protein
MRCAASASPSAFDLAVLWQWSGEVPAVIRPTHVHPRPGPGQSDTLSQEAYPWVVKQMLAGRAVVVRSLDDLPADATTDRESARSTGIKSNLTLPLAVGGEPPVGALAFNALQAERDWPEALVQWLELAAQVLTNALARRRHELWLHESQERLALAADSAEAGLWSLDLRTGVFWLTERARTLFGFAADEVVTLTRLGESVHPDDRERVRDAVATSERSGEPAQVEYRIIHPSRGVRWIDSRGRPQPGPDGRPAGSMGVSIDITERKGAEGAIRAGRDRLEAAADLAGFASYEVDFAAGTAFLDERFRDLSGVPPEREPGLGPVEFWMERVHPEDRERVLALRRQLHDGTLEALNVEYRYRHPARGERWFHHVARVTSRDSGGRAVKTFGVLRDITDRRQREEALKQSYAEIERLKDRLQAESDYLKAEIKVVHPHGEVTGRSPAIQKVLRQVEQVAPTDSSVLVRGETGSGKELVAQAIHRQSPRRGHLLIKVNCAALPSGLVESELFGREKGAYTGAMTRQIGRFEVADGSTLFLDEIGELSLELQAKLLRVLETGEFERLGSPRTIKVDVRLIAATNRDLVEEVRKGRFREDLYYRLNVFPIRVPPLRERAEDIPLLVWTFLGEISARMGKKITQVPRKTMEALQRHPWPGNVRELKNAIEHGAILTTGDTLQVPMLDDAAPVGAPPPTLADSERELILRALERAGWRIKGPRGAAAALGLNPSTLYSRMKKLGIRQSGESP